MRTPAEFSDFQEWAEYILSTSGRVIYESEARAWVDYWDRVLPLKNAVVAYLGRHPAATSDEVTQAMRNVIPYVPFLGRAIKALIQEKNLRAVVKKKGRGRPATFYSLT
jgi:hypothetical protein